MNISRNEVHQLLTKAMEDLKIIENNPILKPSDKTNTNYLANRKKIVKALEELPTEEL